jgi:tetratricopeptide (TPR) repeat protein
VLTTDRAVLIRYMRDGKPRRGSGLRVASYFVLTADHCANGIGHTVIAGGAEYPAAVFVRSGNTDVDVAVLVAPSLQAVKPLECAVMDREVPWEVDGCRALGFPVWKDSAAGPRLAQVPGNVPTAEGVDPWAGPAVVPPMSLKITNPDIRDRRFPEGDLDQPGSPWAGMSGAVVVTADDLVVGVIRGHSPAEGAGSLTATRIEAIASLPNDVVRLFLDALQMTDLQGWSRVPLPMSDRASTVVATHQVVVGEIPREPPAFVMRETLARLADTAGREQTAVVCAVTGLRGVGKTQVAAAYARQRVSQGWGLVGWVNAETRDTLLSGLALVAERLGVADPDGDSLKSAARLREHLQTRTTRGLLVFDNAADSDGLRTFLPATGSTQVVITTTDMAFTELGNAVDVAAFSRTESLGYLKSRTALADEAGAASVAHELGDLPLGLAQAATTIRGQHLTYAKYLMRLRCVPVQKLLGRVPGGDYPRSAAAALLLSIQAAEAGNHGELTGRLLRVLAVLSPDGIRCDLLEGLTVDEPDIAEGEVDAAIEHCVAGSLLTWSVTGDAVIMHRLLGRVLRERDQVGGQWTSTVNAALNMLEPRLFPEQQAWVRREEGTHLVGQIEAVWEADAAGNSDPDLRARELRARSWAVRQLRTATDLSRAIDLGTRTSADCERVLGADHPHTLTAHNDLASVYRSASRVGQAISLFEQTLADRERMLGADHPDTLTSRKNLASAYRAAGRVEQAIPLFEQTLADRERVLGADHPDNFAVRNNLGYAYESAGRVGQAISLLEQTLADCERVLGADHPDTLTARNNLAGAYRSAGRVGQAISLLEQALADCERVLGADHPQTLTARNNLAGAYQSAGRVGQAISLLEQTLADRERVLGADHPDTVTARNNLERARMEAKPG